VYSSRGVVPVVIFECIEFPRSFTLLAVAVPDYFVELSVDVPLADLTTLSATDSGSET